MLAVEHSILFLVLWSLRLQFLSFRCGSVTNSSLTSASLHSHDVPVCPLIPATARCPGKEWVVLLAEPFASFSGARRACLFLGLCNLPAKWFLCGVQTYKTALHFFINSIPLWRSAVQCFSAREGSSLQSLGWWQPAQGLGLTVLLVRAPPYLQPPPHCACMTSLLFVWGS